MTGPRKITASDGVLGKAQPFQNSLLRASLQLTRGDDHELLTDLNHAMTALPATGVKAGLREAVLAAIARKRAEELVSVHGSTIGQIRPNCNAIRSKSRGVFDRIHTWPVFIA